MFFSILIIVQQLSSIKRNYKRTIKGISHSLGCLNMPSWRSKNDLGTFREAIFRDFSILQGIKTFLRNTMNETRLNV